MLTYIFLKRSVDLQVVGMIVSIINEIELKILTSYPSNGPFSKTHIPATEFLFAEEQQRGLKISGVHNVGR